MRRRLVVVIMQYAIFDPETGPQWPPTLFVMGVGDGNRGSCAPPPQKKIMGKYFTGNYRVKFGNFSGKYHVKFGHFFSFSYKYFGQKCIPPKVD